MDLNHLPVSYGYHDLDEFESKGIYNVPTMIELRQTAKDLNLKGYSALKKPALEEMINKEVRRREDAKLAEIRQRASEQRPASLLPKMTVEELADEADFSKYDDVEIPITVVKGKGIDNMARVRNYCNQPTNRDHLTAAQARRIRKNYRRGDMTVPLSLLFAGPSVNTAMGVA